jgi:hypothetical protein
VLLEELGKLKNPMTSSGIEPATFPKGDSQKIALQIYG